MQQRAMQACAALALVAGSAVDLIAIGSRSEWGSSQPAAVDSHAELPAAAVYGSLWHSPAHDPGHIDQEPKEERQLTHSCGAGQVHLVVVAKSCSMSNCDGEEGVMVAHKDTDDDGSRRRGKQRGVGWQTVRIVDVRSHHPSPIVVLV